MPYTALRRADVGSLACSSFAGRSFRPPGKLQEQGTQAFSAPSANVLLACGFDHLDTDANAPQKE